MLLFPDWIWRSVNPKFEYTENRKRPMVFLALSRMTHLRITESPNFFDSLLWHSSGAYELVTEKTLRESREIRNSLIGKLHGNLERRIFFVSFFLYCRFSEAALEQLHILTPTVELADTCGTPTLLKAAQSAASA